MKCTNPIEALLALVFILGCCYFVFTLSSFALAVFLGVFTGLTTHELLGYYRG